MFVLSSNTWKYKRLYRNTLLSKKIYCFLISARDFQRKAEYRENQAFPAAMASQLSVAQPVSPGNQNARWFDKCLFDLFRELNSMSLDFQAIYESINLLKC